MRTRKERQADIEAAKNTVEQGLTSGESAAKSLSSWEKTQAEATAELDAEIAAISEFIGELEDLA